MRTVEILEVQLTNFRSFTSHTVTWPKGNGLYYLGGDNEVEPRLGGNAAGKSSLLEAITWCFYGKSIRARGINQLKTRGAEFVSVSVTVRVGEPSIEQDEIRTVTRQGPPERLFLDGELVPSVDSFLGLSFDRFLHSVIFGQGQPLFPDLTIAERGLIFDTVLDLGTWLKASDAAAVNSIETGKLIDAGVFQLSNIEGQLKGLLSHSELVTMVESFEKQRQDQLTQLKQDHDAELGGLRLTKEQLLVEQTQLSAQYEEARSILEITPISKSTVDTLQAELRRHQRTVGQLRSQWAQAERDVARLKKDLIQLAAGICPACGQTLEDSSRRQKHTDTFRDLGVAEANLGNTTTMLATSERLENELQKKYEDELEKHSAASAKRSEASANYNHSARALSAIKLNLEGANNVLEGRVLTNTARQIQSLMAQPNPHIKTQNETRIRREQLTAKAEELEANIFAFGGQRDAYDYWRQAFKQIRLYYINEVLASLTIEMNSAIVSLGLEGWRVELVTETENKSGTMKLGVQIVVRSADGVAANWEDWSGGEAQRLRIGMAIGMASLIQRASQVVFSFEVWDEPSNWLSETGIEDLLVALAARAEMKSKQVFVVDHRALTYSGFNAAYVVRKGAEGSKVYKL
jgi:DNA repair exonuclease SbcCD ATPase subunit